MDKIIILRTVVVTHTCAISGQALELESQYLKSVSLYLAFCRRFDDL